MTERATRRGLFRAAAWLTMAGRAAGAPPFWNRKQPVDWSEDEILQMLNRSPWARETNLDLELVEGGHIQNLPTGAPAQPGEGKPQIDTQAAPMQRTPVVVRWESAQPVRDALQIPMLKGFEGRYVIGVSNIPFSAMNRPRRGAAPVTEVSLEGMLAELQGAATLETPGREPVGAGLVKHVAGSENNYQFGFERELLPLTGSEKEIWFVLRTARVSVRTKFEPKSMVYRGHFAV